MTFLPPGFSLETLRDSCFQHPPCSDPTPGDNCSTPPFPIATPPAKVVLFPLLTWDGGSRRRPRLSAFLHRRFNPYRPDLFPAAGHQAPGQSDLSEVGLNVPCLADYWRRDQSGPVHPICGYMTQTRFEQITRSSAPAGRMSQTTLGQGTTNKVAMQDLPER